MKWNCFISGFVLWLSRVAEDRAEGFAFSVLPHILFKCIQLNCLIPGANAWCDLLGYSSYKAFTGWKCLFLLFQLLPNNPFLFIFFFQKRRKEVLWTVLSKRMRSSKQQEKKAKKKKGTACSLFFCKVPLISFNFSIILMHRRFWSGFKQARSSARGAEPSPKQLRARCARGHLPFMALSLGELWEGIQTSRKLVRHRFILFRHSHSHMMVNKREIVLSAPGITAVLFAVRWQQVLSRWQRALAQGEFGWLSAQPFSFLLADLRRAPHCKGPLYWVLQCCGVISDNASVSHPSLSPHLCSCRQELIGFSWLIKHALLDSKLRSLLLNISQEQLCSARIWMAQQFCIHFHMKWFQMKESQRSWMKEAIQVPSAFFIAIDAPCSSCFNSTIWNSGLISCTF